MNVSTRIKCFKYLVYSYIILLTISGGVQIVFGGTLLWTHLGHTRIIENKFWAPATVFICLGPITFCLCWLGWSGTSKKNRCALGFFVAMLVLLICGQFLICGWAIAMRQSLPSKAELPVDESFSQFVELTKVDTTHMWNQMQAEFKCCGVDGPHDYRRATAAVPWSCCTRPENPTDASCASLYQRGCLHVVSDITRESLFNLAMAAIVSAIVQSLGLFCVIQLMIIVGPRKNLNDIGVNQIRPKHRKELLPLASTAATAPQPPPPQSKSIQLNIESTSTIHKKPIH